MLKLIKEILMKRTIVAMPGDGIGKTVLPEAIRVLDKVGFEAEYVHADIGWDFWILDPPSYTPNICQGTCSSE